MLCLTAGLDTRTRNTKSFAPIDFGLHDEVMLGDASVHPQNPSDKAKQGIPLPNAKPLLHHAAICRVLHTSGASETLNAYVELMQSAGIRSLDTIPGKILFLKHIHRARNVLPSST